MLRGTFRWAWACPLTGAMAPNGRGSRQIRSHRRVHRNTRWRLFQGRVLQVYTPLFSNLLVCGRTSLKKQKNHLAQENRFSQLLAQKDCIELGIGFKKKRGKEKNGGNGEGVASKTLYNLRKSSLILAKGWLCPLVKQSGRLLHLSYRLHMK